MMFIIQTFSHSFGHSLIAKLNFQLWIVVVVKNVEPMTVVSGNPAKELRKRACIHADLPVERLLHGDYKQFKDTYKKKK